MGESLKPANLSENEKNVYGSFTPDQVARIAGASLLNDPENSETVSYFINKVHLKEQFIILLLKGIDIQSTAFFENIIGICETRIKEAKEKSSLKETDNE